MDKELAWFPVVASPCERKGALVFYNWSEICDLDPRGPIKELPRPDKKEIERRILRSMAIHEAVKEYIARNRIANQKIP